MSDTPICDKEFFVTEQDYEVVPMHVAKKLECDLAAEKEANVKHFQDNSRRFQQLERALAFEVELRVKAEEDWQRE